MKNMEVWDCRGKGGKETNRPENFSHGAIEKGRVKTLNSKDRAKKRRRQWRSCIGGQRGKKLWNSVPGRIKGRQNRAANPGGGDHLKNLN